MLLEADDVVLVFVLPDFHVGSTVPASSPSSRARRWDLAPDGVFVASGPEGGW